MSPLGRQHLVPPKDNLPPDFCSGGPNDDQGRLGHNRPHRIFDLSLTVYSSISRKSMDLTHQPGAVAGPVQSEVTLFLTDATCPSGEAACFLPTLVASTNPQSEEETDVLVNHTLRDASQPLDTPVTCPAKALTPAQRQRLALDALAGPTPVTRLAQQHQVSRKFVYHQAHKAQQVLEDAFTTDPPVRDDRVLFSLPVTNPDISSLLSSISLMSIR
jgi:hypothetical protein